MREESLTRTKTIGNYTPIEAFIYSGMVVLVGLFAFEIFWVPLYNYFNFGSWVWPIYIFEHKPLSLSFYRNHFFILIPLLYAGFLFKIMFPLIKFRMNYKTAIMLGLLLISWGVWITYDSPLQIRDASNVLIVDEPFITNTSTFPTQGFFPQTVYTFYNVSQGTFHQREDVQAWHQEDTITHIMNLVSKYLTFGLVTYIFAVTKKED